MQVRSRLELLELMGKRLQHLDGMAVGPSYPVQGIRGITDHLQN